MKIKIDLTQEQFTTLLSILDNIPKVLSNEKICDLFKVMDHKFKVEAIEQGELDYHYKSFGNILRKDIRELRKAFQPAYLESLTKGDD